MKDEKEHDVPRLDPPTPKVRCRECGSWVEVSQTRVAGGAFLCEACIKKHDD
jgi:formylmethanofuran dehydrogenase subunit E